jgi:hypothetical protein
MNKIFLKGMVGADMDKVNEDMQVYKENEFEILKECIQKAHHMLIFDRHKEFKEYCNSLCIFPNDYELDKYRK